MPAESNRQRDGDVHINLAGSFNFLSLLQDLDEEESRFGASSGTLP